MLACECILKRDVGGSFVSLSLHEVSNGMDEIRKGEGGLVDFIEIRALFVSVVFDESNEIREIDVSVFISVSGESVWEGVTVLSEEISLNRDLPPQVSFEFDADEVGSCVIEL